MGERIEVDLGLIKEVTVLPFGGWVGTTEEGRRYTSSGTCDPDGSDASFIRKVFPEFLETDSVLLIEDPDSGRDRVVPIKSARFWRPVGWKP